MLDACLAAYRMTGEKPWLHAGRRAFEWFLGRNDLSAPMHDFVTGACYDGLHADRINQNQGAEATTSWLLSLLLMHELDEESDSRSESAGKAELERFPGKPVPRLVTETAPSALVL
jgi:hypothetical protein